MFDMRLFEVHVQSKILGDLGQVFVQKAQARLNLARSLRHWQG